MYLRSIIAIAGMLVTSCLSPHQTVVTDTGGGTWSESAEIEIPNADTVTPATYTSSCVTTTPFGTTRCG